MLDDYFSYDKENDVYMQTLKLPDGYMARIYFIQYKIDIDSLGIRGIWSWNVGLAIGKSKKELNAWFYGLKPNQIYDNITYKKYGLRVLVWAKEQIELFQTELRSNEIFSIRWTNEQRHRVYKRGLSSLGFKEMQIQYRLEDSTDRESYLSLIYVPENFYSLRERKNVC